MLKWPNRFNVQAGRWLCRTRTCTDGRYRDVFDLIAFLENLDIRADFRQICQILGGIELERPRSRSQPLLHPPLSTVVPSALWQKRARAFATDAQKQLWQPTGRRALAWLKNKRGFTENTIRQARLGWNPRAEYNSPSLWGLPADRRRIWLARGIVIPWYIDDCIWRVNIRRPDADLARDRTRGRKNPAKYIGPAGYGQGLYNADALLPDHPAAMVESEFDCLSIVQYAGDLTASVATGSTCHGLRFRWRAKLLACSFVLLIFDADGNDGLDGLSPSKGEAAALRWMEHLPHAIRWRPRWHDVNQMACEGADIRAWIKAGLSFRTPPEPPASPITIIWPPDQALATIHGQTRRLADGRLEAWYDSLEELATCLDLTQFARQLSEAASTGRSQK